MGAKKKRAEKQAAPSLRPCDRAAVIYRSEDPLENLKIRVQLKSLSPPTKVADEPQPEREPEAEKAKAEDDGAENEDDAGGEEEEADEDVEPEPVRWALSRHRIAYGCVHRI